VVQAWAGSERLRQEEEHRVLVGPQQTQLRTLAAVAAVLVVVLVVLVVLAW
jgi:hypothetical protein